MFKNNTAIVKGTPYAASELSEAGYQHILAAAKREFQLENNRPAFGYFTFMDGGFDKEIVTLHVADHLPKFVAVSAPEDSVDAAIDWVMQHNPDLKFDRSRAVDESDAVGPGQLKNIRLYFLTVS